MPLFIFLTPFPAHLYLSRTRVKPQSPSQRTEKEARSGLPGSPDVQRQVGVWMGETWAQGQTGGGPALCPVQTLGGRGLLGGGGWPSAGVSREMSGGVRPSLRHSPG